MLKPIEKTGIEINNDAKILATALYYKRTFAPNDMIFVSNMGGSFEQFYARIS